MRGAAFSDFVFSLFWPKGRKKKLSLRLFYGLLPKRMWDGKQLRETDRQTETVTETEKLWCSNVYETLPHH